MGLGFSRRAQLLLTQWGTVTSGALVAQFDEWAAALTVLAPITEHVRLPYQKSATLLTDSTGIPLLHVQARASVSRSTAQVVTTGTVTTLSFDTELFDVGDMWNPAFPTRLTVPIGGAGTYLVSAIVPWAANAAGTFRQIRILKSGVTQLVLLSSAPTAFIVDQQRVELLTAIDGDYFEVQGLHDVGGNLNAGVIGGTNLQFSAMKLAAA